MSDCDCPTYCPHCGEALKEIEPSPRPSDVVGKWVDIGPFVKIHKVKSARYVGNGTDIVTECGLGYGLYSKEQVSDKPSGKRARDCQNCVRKVERR